MEDPRMSFLEGFLLVGVRRGESGWLGTGLDVILHFGVFTYLTYLPT